MEETEGVGICEFCGKENAMYRADPTMEELSGIIVMKYICNDCYKDMCLEI